MFKSFNKNSNSTLIVFILLLFPLFIVNINGHNNWGGDFSQYIHQAVNISNGIAQSEQYYIFNPNYSELAAPNYFPGFPIIISPVISKYGVDYIALAYYMSFLLILLSITWFFLLKKFFNPILSAFSILLVVYSPFFLIFKNEVLADFPFIIFITLSFIFLINILKKDKHFYLNIVLLTLSTSFAILIKPLGLSLIIAYIIYIFLLLFLKPNDYKQFIYGLLTVSILGFICYKVAIPLLLETTEKQDSHFFKLFAWNNMKFIVLHNLSYYYNEFIRIFRTYASEFKLFNTIFMQVVSLSFIYGLYTTIKKGIDFLFIYFIIYLSVVLLFPHQQGVRYILPVFVILIYYILQGIKNAPFPTIKKKYILISLVFIGYILPLRMIIVNFEKANSTYVENWGPLTKEASETFQFISKNTTKEDIIVFYKPRVLALHTKRKSFSNQNNYTDLNQISEDIYQFSPKYILRTIELENNALNIFLENNADLSIVFENEKYTLYQLE